MTTVTFNDTNTWVALATTATVDCIGAGGAGGTNATGGGGGGGGGFSRKAVTGLVLGRSYHIRFAGGQVFFGPDTVAANALCLANNGANASGGTGGAGGSAETAVGDTKRAGGNGGNGATDAGGGGGASATFAAVGNNGSNGAGGVGGAGGEQGSGDGATGLDADTPGSPDDGVSPGGGGGGGSNIGSGSNGGVGSVEITFTAQVEGGVPTPNTTLKETPIVNKLLDPLEVLTATPGVIPVTTTPATINTRFIGFDLRLSGAAASVTFRISSSGGTVLWQCDAGKFPAGGQLFLRNIRIPVPVGETIRISGGENNGNAIFNGTVFWE